MASANILCPEMRLVNPDFVLTLKERARDVILRLSPGEEGGVGLMLKPLGDRIVVKVLESEERTEGGIYLPDTAKEKPQKGEVVAVGPGRLIESGPKAGEVIPLEVKVGDKVLFSKYGGTEVKIEGEEYKILSMSDVLAIIEE